MLIRLAEKDDLPAIAKIHVDTWHSTYKNIVPDEFLRSLTYRKKIAGWEKRIFSDSERKEFMYVAETKNGKIIGFASAGLNEGDLKYGGRMYTIYILKDYQRKGIGRKLFKAVTIKLKQMGIHSMVVSVLQRNPSGYFYEHLGAKKVAESFIEKCGKKLKTIIYGWEKI